MPQLQYSLTGEASQFVNATSQAGNAASEMGQELTTLQQHISEVTQGTLRYDEAMSRYRDEAGQFVAATDAQEAAMAALREEGIRTEQQIQEEIERLEALRNVKGDDAVATQELSARISELRGELSQAESALRESEQAAELLQSGFENGVTQTRELAQAQDYLQAQAEQSGTAIRQSGNAVDDFSGKATTMRSSASAAANNLGFEMVQAAQDAQFGMAGVANQIPLMTEQFEQLRMRTGSAASAFSTLGSTFLGTTGVLAVVTLGVQALPGLVNWLTETGEAADEAGESASEAADQFQRLATVSEELSAVAQQNRESVQALREDGDALEEAITLLNERYNQLNQQWLTNVNIGRSDVLPEMNAIEALFRQLRGETENTTEAFLAFQELGLSTQLANDLAEIATNAGEAGEAMQALEVDTDWWMDMEQEQPPNPLDNLAPAGQGPALPATGGGVFDQTMLRLRQFQRAAQTSLIGPMRLARQQASALRRGMQQMLAQGISPSSQQFQVMEERLSRVRREMEMLQVASAGVQALTQGFGQIARVLGSAEQELASFGDVARSILGQTATAMGEQFLAMAPPLAIAGQWGKAAAYTAAGTTLIGIGSALSSRGSVAEGQGGSGGGGQRAFIPSPDVSGTNITRPVSPNRSRRSAAQNVQITGRLEGDGDELIAVIDSAQQRRNR